MGTFRSGLIACLLAGVTAFADDNNPANPAAPAPIPGVLDTNAPAVPPAIPPDQNAIAPLPVDPNAIAPLDATTTTNAPAKPKKAAAPAIPTFRGTVATIDKNAMTISVHGKAKDETFAITSKTRIFADNKPAILADAREGENVVVEYHTGKDKSKDATALRLGGSGSGASISKSDKSTPTKPAKTTKAKKSAKKKKTAAPKNSTTTPTLPDTSAQPAPVPETSATPAPAPNPAAPAPVPGANP